MDKRWPAELADQKARLDALFAGVRYAKQCGAALSDWGLGWAVVTATPGDEATNLAGTVHGGVLASLADLAFEVACNSYGRLVVATELNLHYAAAATPDLPLTASATEITRSRRLASYRIEVTAGHGIVAWAQAVAYRTNAWHGGEDAYPREWRDQY